MTAPTAAAATAQAAPAQAVQPSLAEQLSTFGRNAWTHLMQLEPREVGLNLLVSAGILLLALGVIWVLRRLFDHWLNRFADACATEVSTEDKRTPKAVGVTWALLRLAILAGALLFVISVWGIDPWALLADGAGSHLLRLVLIAVLVVALVEVAGFVIRRLVEGFAVRSRDPRRTAQLRSLGPLLTGSVQGVLIVVGVLTFLTELGLQVGPLLASAGVLGLAVGFGAQTIVKDFLTGLFLIAEDVVSVGDNVRIGDAAGTVEAMTVRTIRLRNQNGTLHIFPYSEAQVIHNRTKVFSSYVFEIPVSYDADVDHALELMQKVGDEITADPAFKDMITKPFELLGVDKLSESAVTLKGRLVTEPKSQWKVGREYNRRIQKAFAEAQIVSPYTTVQMMRQAGDEPAIKVQAQLEPRSFDPSEDRPQS